MFGLLPPTMERLRLNIPAGLVVIEDKSFDTLLYEQIPYGVCELYAFAKSLGSAHPPSIFDLYLIKTTLP